MSEVPVFPAFKPLELADRPVIHGYLQDYQPESSELTFTNMFIWKDHYGFRWSRLEDYLVVVSAAAAAGEWALPPVGPPPRAGVVRTLLARLREQGVADPHIERADPRLAKELAEAGGFEVEPVRDHFDYIYHTSDLIELAGGEYHAKRNYINTFKRSYAYSYEPIDENHLAACLRLAENWCQMRRCEDDLNLMGEWEAIGLALANFAALELHGAVIVVDREVQAFSLGEMLNGDTAVIHIEKANPEIRGLYTMINQQFLENAWAGVPFVNREQDLGEPGLRVAKLSYHPHHFVEKFQIRPR